MPLLLAVWIFNMTIRTEKLGSLIWHERHLLSMCKGVAVHFPGCIWHILWEIY
jgi:hypothetical protein